MNRKLLLGVSFSACLFLGAAQAAVFPGAFATPVKGQNCSVASDIVPAFCQPSGAGSFAAAVQGCCPLGKIPMKAIYAMMIEEYGSLQGACAANAVQYGSNPATCVAQWTCYFHGGKSTDLNGLCNGNGQACESAPSAA